VNEQQKYNLSWLTKCVFHFDLANYPPRIIVTLSPLALQTTVNDGFL
jgi:hypothetical protein